MRTAPIVALCTRLVRWAPLAALWWSAGCGGADFHPEELPEELQEPYRSFAFHCSRCHTLSRPLTARVNKLEHWDRYVARMRRMPGSGISERDGRVILRFLYYYTTVVRGGGEETFEGLDGLAVPDAAGDEEEGPVDESEEGTDS